MLEILELLYLPWGEDGYLSVVHSSLAAACDPLNPPVYDGISDVNVFLSMMEEAVKSRGFLLWMWLCVLLLLDGGQCACGVLSPALQIETTCVRHQPAALSVSKALL